MDLDSSPDIKRNLIEDKLKRILLGNRSKSVCGETFYKNDLFNET